MLAAVLGWVLPSQSTPILLHKRPKGRFGLHAIVLAEILVEHQGIRLSWCKTCNMKKTNLIFWLFSLTQHRVEKFMTLKASQKML